MCFPFPFPWRRRIDTPPLPSSYSKAELSGGKTTTTTTTTITSVLDINAVTLAEQLTLVAARDYNRIPAAMLMMPEAETEAEKKEEQGGQGINLDRAIRYSNAIYEWVLSEIIMIKTEGNRRMQQVQILEHFIAVADACRGLNDFAMVMALVSALMTRIGGPVEEIREYLSKESRIRLEGLEVLSGPRRGFYEYRCAVREVEMEVPCVPCLGSFSAILSSSSSSGSDPVADAVSWKTAFALTDLRFIQEGMPSWPEEKKEEKIALKRAKVAAVVAEIQRFQEIPYAIAPRADVQRFLEARVGVAFGMGADVDDEECSIESSISSLER